MFAFRLCVVVCVSIVVSCVRTQPNQANEARAPAAALGARILRSRCTDGKRSNRFISGTCPPRAAATHALPRWSTGYCRSRKRTAADWPLWAGEEGGVGNASYTKHAKHATRTHTRTPHTHLTRLPQTYKHLTRVHTQEQTRKNASPRTLHWRARASRRRGGRTGRCGGAAESAGGEPGLHSL